MENLNLYQDIQARTNGDIYIGVVGPVRTGKSTFIKKFMDLLVIPNIDNEFKKERAVDELPQSSQGRPIMTTEPKFVPSNAANIKIDDFSANATSNKTINVTVPTKTSDISNDSWYITKAVADKINSYIPA